MQLALPLYIFVYVIFAPLTGLTYYNAQTLQKVDLGPVYFNPAAAEQFMPGGKVGVALIKTAPYLPQVIYAAALSEQQAAIVRQQIATGQTLVMMTGMQNAVFAMRNGTTVTPITGMKMPGFPDWCQQQLAATKKPCRWQVKLYQNPGGDRMIKIVLEWDGRIIAEGEIMQLPIKGLVEQIPAGLEGSKVWVHAIRVAEFARNSGIGAAVWRAADGVAAQQSAQAGDKALMLFADSAGWGPALMNTVQTIWSQGGYWLYWADAH